MTVVLNDLLDPDIEAGAKARPRYSTDIITTDGGWEVRNSRWAYPLFQYEFNLMPGYRHDDEAIDAFIDTFHVVGGSAGAFQAGNLVASSRNGDDQDEEITVTLADGDYALVVDAQQGTDYVLNITPVTT